MNSLKEHLKILQKVKRHKYHPIIHKIHKKYKISKKTLLYVKEYGPHSNVSRSIIKESLKILLFASLISSFGGLALESAKTVFVSIMPLIILLPALNDMIGDYGIIISSRFSTMLHTGELKGKWHKNKDLRETFLLLLIISFMTAVISAGIALAISFFSGYETAFTSAQKIFFISIIDSLFLVSALFIISIIGGIHFFKKNEDPDNFLIPLTTSIADLGNMIILAGLTLLFF
jgi:mgtE-like transporter